MPEVIFIKVKDNQTKLDRICDTTETYFQSKKSILILVPNTQAVKYIDDLLWKKPIDSFIPHSKQELSKTDRILIKTVDNRDMKADVIINLCSEIPRNLDFFSTIIELYDFTEASKEKNSEQKFKDYAASGLSPIFHDQQ